MLAESKNASLYADWLDHVRDAQARTALIWILGYAACLREWHCHPQQKGAVRDVRFCASDGQQHFAFIVNVESILFYFRKPAIAAGHYALSTLRRRFDGAEENNSGEWTVRLRGQDDAQRLAEYLALS